MKTKSLFLLLITIFTFSMGCKRLKLCEDEKLTMVKTPFSGNTMRIDGIYHASFDDSQSVAILIFHSNGVFQTSTKTETSLSEIEAEIVNGSFYEAQKNAKGRWGLFQVDGDLYVESWKITPGCYTTVRLKGAILNDTTIKVGNSILVDNLSLTYHFKAFTPKPDSTNQFIP